MLRLALFASISLTTILSSTAHSFIYERNENGIRHFTQMPEHPMNPRWAEDKINLEIFAAEAKEVFQQAAQAESRLIPWVIQIRKKLTNAQKTNQLASKISAWNSWANSTDAGSNHVRKIGQMSRKLFSAIRSYNSSLEKESLIVPLSPEYFACDVEFAKFFRKEWLGSGFDVRLFGNSGEGVTTQTPEYFAQMVTLFTKTKRWLAANPRSVALLRPESLWLNSLSLEQLKTIQRMIFIHDQSWNFKADAPFADYIAVDPQLMGIRPIPLLSILIHELNVNSMNFLFQDTHLPLEVIEESRRINSGATVLTSYEYMGRQPLLSLVYLAMVLE